MKHMQKIFSGRGLRGVRAEPQINSLMMNGQLDLITSGKQSLSEVNFLWRLMLSIDIGL